MVINRWNFPKRGNPLDTTTKTLPILICVYLASFSELPDFNYL